jgi:hypothetical protein
MALQIACRTAQILGLSRAGPGTRNARGSPTNPAKVFKNKYLLARNRQVDKHFRLRYASEVLILQRFDPEFGDGQQR